MVRNYNCEPSRVEATATSWLHLTAKCATKKKQKQDKKNCRNIMTKLPSPAIVFCYPACVFLCVCNSVESTSRPSGSHTFSSLSLFISPFSQEGIDARSPLCFSGSSPENGFLATMSSACLVGSSGFFFPSSFSCRTFELFKTQLNLASDVCFRESAEDGLIRASAGAR